jgi:replicative DNA helicase
MYRRPTYRDLVGNMDKDADHVLIAFQARPIIAGMEPEEGTSDYQVWQAAMDEAVGKAEIILSLSRERESPRRKEIIWNGSTTSYGPDFKSQANDGRLI